LPIIVKVLGAAAGYRPHLWGFDLMRKFLIALFFAASAVAMTATMAFAGSGGLCCYSAPVGI